MDALLKNHWKPSYSQWVFKKGTSWIWQC